MCNPETGKWIEYALLRDQSGTFGLEEEELKAVFLGD